LIELEKIELLDGRIRCNPILLGLDFLVLVHFIYSWYRQYKHTGLKLDYWHLMIFKLFIINVFILYPFNASYFNKVSIGHLIVLTDKWVDQAFLITCSGYCCFIIGGFFYEKMLFRYFEKSDFFSIEKFVENNIKDKISSNLLVILSLILIMVMFSLVYQSGNFFNPRGYFLADASIRPIYNLTIALYPISVIFIGLKYIEYHKNTYLYLFLFLVFLSFFLGVRSAILESIVVLFLFYYFKNHSTVSFLQIFLVVILIVILAFKISILRNDTTTVDFIGETLYGNHFSDTRDFALLLSYFDFNWLEGKTYISGIITFIPRKYSEFREEWAWGIYAARILGIVDPLFPGHRPGFFGEMYINFNIWGVIILGLFSGAVVKHIDFRILKEYNNNNDVIKMYSYTVLMWLVLSLAISIIFVFLYTFIIIIIFLAIIRQFILYLKKKKI
jgi:oligosaccharide repeat unit polymerase